MIRYCIKPVLKALTFYQINETHVFVVVLIVNACQTGNKIFGIPIENGFVNPKQEN